LALVPLILDWPLVLSPVHIVFLELIIDPACSIAFEAEPEETDVMARPPRDPKAPLFGMRDIILSISQGFVVLMTVLLVFGIALYRAQGDNEARALTFATLVIGMLGLIFANRSWSTKTFRVLRSPNRAFWWVVAGAIGFLAMVLYIPYLREVFRFAALRPYDLAICLVAGALSVLWFEIAKFARTRNP
jgi:Ca2+-transporting ATPase